MSSEDLIFTSSSDSEDSEVSFISDYVMEVEGSPNSSDQDGEDSDEAYADEPLADEEWLEIYEEERKANEELEKQLLHRLNGTEEVSKWLVVVAINKHASVSTNINL